MRVTVLMLLLMTAVWADEAFGTWKVNPSRSTAADPDGNSITVRIESHAKGEVFTLERVAGDRRATTVSSILYLDGRARDFQDGTCSGSQQSRRLDSRTIEILRICDGGQKMRLVRQLATPRELILNMTDQDSHGKTTQRRLVLEKQTGAEDR